MNDIDADREGEPTNETVEPLETETTSIPADPQEPATTPVPVEPADEAEAPGPQRERVFAGTGLVWGLVVGVLLAVLLVILIAQNTQSTTIEFFVWEYSTPLIVVILAALVVGVVFDELIGLVHRHRRRRMLSEREQLRQLQTTSED